MRRGCAPESSDNYTVQSLEIYFVAEQDYDYVEPRHHAMRLLSEGVISVLGHGNVSGTKVVVALVP